MIENVFIFFSFEVIPFKCNETKVFMTKSKLDKVLEPGENFAFSLIGNDRSMKLGSILPNNELSHNLTLQTFNGMVSCGAKLKGSYGITDEFTFSKSISVDISKYGKYIYIELSNLLTMGQNNAEKYYSVSIHESNQNQSRAFLTEATPNYQLNSTKMDISLSSVSLVLSLGSFLLVMVVLTIFKWGDVIKMKSITSHKDRIQVPVDESSHL